MYPDRTLLPAASHCRISRGMTGTFDCTSSFKIENFPTSDFTQVGLFTGCHGTGDFEGMNLWAYVSNEDHPGLGDTATHDFHGVIWWLVVVIRPWR